MKGRALAKRGLWDQAEVVHQGMAVLPGRRPVGPEHHSRRLTNNRL